MSGLTELLMWAAFFAVPAVMFLMMKSRRKNAARKLELLEEIPPGNPEMPTDMNPPKLMPTPREGFVLLDRFDRMHSYSHDHLEQMLAIMRSAGIHGYYEFRGVRTKGAGEYELWAEKEKAELAIQVLREKYFNT